MCEAKGGKKMIPDGYEFCEVYLRDTETILWTGKPEEALDPTKRVWEMGLSGGLNIGYAVFALFWVGFVIWWTITAGNAFFTIFGIFGILFGLYWFVGSRFYIPWRRKQTKYVVTNLRVVRQQRKNVDVLRYDDVHSIHVRMYENGNGTIYFNTDGWTGEARMRKIMMQPEVAGDMLFHIENVAQVEYLRRILEENIPK
jgi:hypothetical protein